MMLKKRNPSEIAPEAGEDPCYGIRQVYPSDERPLPTDTKLSLDVLFIHGLNGHARRTFTHPETRIFWPQDLLPEKVPTARVLTYGYISSPKHISEGQNILDIASQLVVNLKDYRREEDEKARDIVFVCHSLGGIIAKKAILLYQSSSEGKAIRNSIAGIMFMATPHCGSNLANIGSAFATIASTVVDMPRLLLKSLSKNSSALYDITREFSSAIVDLQLKIISFYELDPCSPSWWRGRSVLVVDKRSAVLNIPGEEVIAAHANHRGICRFKGPDDPDFRSVWTRIDDFAQAASRKAKLCEDLANSDLSFNIRLEDGPSKGDGVNAQLLPSSLKSKANDLRNKHWNVPFFPCASFTGRNAFLERIFHHFTAKILKTQSRFAIYGLGGVGKTQLALTFAFQQRANYSGVFFLDADGETTLYEDFARIHDDLDLKCPRDKVGAVKRWFDLEDDANWLLIFDNADELESFQLTDYFPVSRSTHIIMTSRDPNVAELASDGLLLEMMEPEESKALLMSKAGITDPSQQDLENVTKIAEDLSHLPLAIDQAGAYIRTRKCSLLTYIRQFERQQERILKFSPKLSSYNKSVVTTWEVSFQRLEAELFVAAKLFLVFCYLDSKRISEELFTGAAFPVLKMDDDGNEHETFAEENGIETDLVDLVMDQDKFDATIELMESLSLVREYTETTGSKDVRIFTLHPLVAWCGRSRAKQPQKRLAAEQAICFLSHAFPEWSRDFSLVEFGRLTRSHLDRCFQYIDKPQEFGSDLGSVASKLLLIIYSIRTIQMFGLKVITTEADLKLLRTAASLLHKYADAYLDVMGVFVKVRQMIKDRPDHPEEVETVMEDYFARSKTQNGRDLANPQQKGRYNAALGDLRNFRASIRQRLNRGDQPDMLLHDWGPVIPGQPSTLERNAKWWIDRNVGTYLVDAGQFDQAETLLRAHVAEFGPVDMEGTDEHLAGADRLARLYYIKRDWPLAREALLGPVDTAKAIDREIGSYHVLHSNVLLQEILVAAGNSEAAARRIDELMPVLKNMALLDITAGPIFAGTCLRAQMAHEQEDWTTATEHWRQALLLGRSVGWPEEIGLAIPSCSLDAIEWERGQRRLYDDDFDEWRQRLFAKRIEAGEAEDFLDGFGVAWKDRLVERVLRIRKVGVKNIADFDY